MGGACNGWSNEYYWIHDGVAHCHRPHCHPQKMAYVCVHNSRIQFPDFHQHCSCDNKCEKFPS
uniref:Uncharacterized protein n=1 Tax=Picea sitchensis TaxID=3332 RepID=A9NL18_PICSI|nr:unknown [Picea sitchensis]